MIDIIHIDKTLEPSYFSYDLHKSSREIIFHNTCGFISGPFQNLNSEDIDNDVSDMWRTMYKLTKSLSDQPGPRNIADRVKGKIDKFKQHMPILHTICNPGIRERHWESVRTVFLLHGHFSAMIVEKSQEVVLTFVFCNFFISVYIVDCIFSFSLSVCLLNYTAIITMIQSNQATATF